MVRLKGGDPYLFGRSAEEVGALVEAGIAVDVVPGISSALAVPGLAGIPVTLRGVAASVTILSGHSAHDSSTPWVQLAKAGGTLVLLMAVVNRGRIAERLIGAGLAPSTPVAAIECGTTPHERPVATTLERLGEEHIAAPAVIVVGLVARFLVATPSG